MALSILSGLVKSFRLINLAQSGKRGNNLEPMEYVV